MKFDAVFVWTFFLVFSRCSAMLLASPVFGAQSTPVPVRVFTTLAISGAMTFAVGVHPVAVPSGLPELLSGVAQELVVGLIIGAFCNLVMHGVQIAGSFIDLQMGLSMSQTMNPATGVPVSVIGQFKYLLGIVLFLSMNGHHVMLKGFAASFDTVPAMGLATLPALNTSLVGTISDICLLALQIAAPVAAVGFVVDASLGIVNKAVPQMQAFMVGVPAKTLMGLLTLGLTLPTLATAIQHGIEQSFISLRGVIH